PGAHQLVSAARPEQSRLGQHWSLWLSRLPDADQSRLPVSRLDPCRADCVGPSFVPRLGATRGNARHSGMAELLLQVAHDRAGAVSRTRLVHPVHEAEEHAALDDGRGFDYAPGAGILRLGETDSQKRWRRVVGLWLGYEPEATVQAKQEKTACVRGKDGVVADARNPHTQRQPENTASAGPRPATP